MFLLVPAHPGFPGQIPQSRKTVVWVCVCAVLMYAVRHILIEPIQCLAQAVAATAAIAWHTT